MTPDPISEAIDGGYNLLALLQICATTLESAEETIERSEIAREVAAVKRTLREMAPELIEAMVARLEIVEREAGL